MSPASGGATRSNWRGCEVGMGSDPRIQGFAPPITIHSTLEGEVVSRKAGSRPTKNKRPRPFDNLHEKKLFEHARINELFKRKQLRGLRSSVEVKS